MEISWTCKTFDELSSKELYEILRLRISVFVVEQNCPYQEADDKDQNSWHVLGRVNGELIAYTRIVPPGISYPEVSIGRVVTATESRKSGTGRKLMDKTMQLIQDKYGSVPIRIGAQAYLLKFYEEFGFIKEGQGYLEDGIPHFIMLYTP